MFSSSGCKHRDVMCFFLMFGGEGSNKMLCGSASMRGYFAPFAEELLNISEFEENHHICIYSKSTTDNSMLCFC